LKGSHDEHQQIRIYRYGKRRCLKKWNNKSTNEKKGHMRYSSGSRWVRQFVPGTPAFYNRYKRKKVLPTDETLSDGFTATQTWIALCKCWTGYILSKHEYDSEGMRMYIGRIRKLQKSLGLEQTEFYGYSPAELAKIDLENDEEYLMERYEAVV
jgi:hypothetical protein